PGAVVAGHAGLDPDEVAALLDGQPLHPRDRVLDRGGGVDHSRPDAVGGEIFLGAEARDLARGADVAEAELLSLLQDPGDEGGVALARILDIDVEDAEIHEAAALVEVVEQLPVELDPL